MSRLTTCLKHKQGVFSPCELPTSNNKAAYFKCPKCPLNKFRNAQTQLYHIFSTRPCTKAMLQAFEIVGTL
ncbi:hypothetical protein NVP1238A_01 [Vibrio phage 1.238.A._10N.261.52.F10]|uniref:Uncharacterized protein n=2 Tax=Pariacacavirus TaxID=2948856 RepID=A0A2I7RUB8_9CAUD|nr:hypothetical protein KNT79_gp01 [Vibrio phage 1.238.A._10N.261.52.F10]YP_010093445.1 hypothetical protein KNT80_gp02 [Vibrio phage 1.245.O._10N.261.54.C7]AUR97250.1 hypothetical protein NVP1238A_01 [Vibrio phage 1.238.A._10N.261.52.F10]AUR97344.1 hypothetical protein NVP1238B_02 [Vibrio phage 1.238.B._10N.261.52.F10]AUR97915.1 hypothetical protein NVP1245O_02 [Vibrio phage 1.245.O._10N.261.54.C7]